MIASVINIFYSLLIFKTMLNSSSSVCHRLDLLTVPALFCNSSFFIPSFVQFSYVSISFMFVLYYLFSYLYIIYFICLFVFIHYSICLFQSSLFCVNGICIQFVFYICISNSNPSYAEISFPLLPLLTCLFHNYSSHNHKTGVAIVCSTTLQSQMLNSFKIKGSF